MTREEAREALDLLNTSIATAVLIIRAHEDTLRAFFAEARSMDSIGPILHPSLFNSSERRATEAVLRPIYEAAQNLVSIYDTHTAKAKDALARVSP